MTTPSERDADGRDPGAASGGDRWIDSGEVQRRAVHAAGAAIPGAYLLDRALGIGAFGWRELQLLYVGGSAFALVLEALRLGGVVDWAIYDRLTREYEQNYLAGYALYVFGMTVAVFAFPPPIAVAALLMLAIGDPVSGVLGSGELGKRPEVLAVMFIVCLALGLPLVSPPVALAGAITATVADGFKPVLWGYVIDDNLTIPIGAGLAMTVTLAFLG